jgi:hypothetical protein
MTDARAALLSIAKEDTGRLLAPELYTDTAGLERLVALRGYSSRSMLSVSSNLVAAISVLATRAPTFAA